jgi:hypothetical protein
MQLAIVVHTCSTVPKSNLRAGSTEEGSCLGGLGSNNGKPNLESLVRVEAAAFFRDRDRKGATIGPDPNNRWPIGSSHSAEPAQRHSAGQ